MRQMTLNDPKFDPKKSLDTLTRTNTKEAFFWTQEVNWTYVRRSEDVCIVLLDLFIQFSFNLAVANFIDYWYQAKN